MSEKTELPEGFNRVHGFDIDGWVNTDEEFIGNVVQGQIVGWMTQVPKRRQPGTRNLIYKLIVKVEQPVRAVTSDGEDIIVEGGGCVVVQLNGKIEYLLQYVKHQARVWMRYLGKKEIKSGDLAGNHVHDWDTAVAVDAKTGPIPEPANKVFKYAYNPKTEEAMPEDTGDANESDIPW